MYDAQTIRNAELLYLEFRADQDQRQTWQFLRVTGYAVLAAMVGVLLASAVLTGLFRHSHPRATWDGARWSCPAGFAVYGDENEALSGKADFVHCIK